MICSDGKKTVQKRRDLKENWVRNTEKQKKIFEKIRKIRTTYLESFLSEKKRKHCAHSKANLI